MRKSMTSQPFIDERTRRMGDEFIRQSKPKLDHMLTTVAKLRLEHNNN